MKKTCLILFSLAVLAGICIVIISAILILAFNRDSRDKNNNTDNEQDTIIDTDNPDMDNDNTKLGEINIESIYNENIDSPEVLQVHVNEVSLALDTFKLLDKENWDGNIDEDLPIDASDYDQSKLAGYISNQEGKEDKLTIPSDLEDTFISSNSSKHINDLMKSARSEYLIYLKAKGTADKYINEIKANALPEKDSRMEYVAKNDPNAEPTSAGGYNTDDQGEKNYSQVNIVIYAVDVYNITDIICTSNILGADDWEKCRDMAVRQLMYHEMTHVLQRAYVTLHVDEEHKKDKSAYVYADKILMDVDDQYFWEWGGSEIISDSNNRQISQESQAEGISFEVLTNVYNMSTVQKEALWSHLFGRLNIGRDNMEQIQQITEENWPKLHVDESGSSIAEVMRGYNKNGESTLVSLTNRLSAFPAYIGYFNPMEPEDTDKFWEFIKK
ncbi:MAG: hypothetical protein US52_C0009G0011 [candidate division WS6 bacterium GW2011_GWA2_37_6]|uniref:Uncharacterized protein n=1 Tax=candidate division WS6 bacterium GW2011_GWA2_37_6 TaxID=1619087 RepID=A0A0G0JH68_9BACT|nr:MAG: hypothetical protein US52_C0009G0011 [candidate division WS6 bacterium GW2011_GWA2_37_6]